MPMFPLTHLKPHVYFVLCSWNAVIAFPSSQLLLISPLKALIPSLPHQTSTQLTQLTASSTHIPASTSTHNDVLENSTPLDTGSAPSSQASPSITTKCTLPIDFHSTSTKRQRSRHRCHCWWPHHCRRRIHILPLLRTQDTIKYSFTSTTVHDLCAKETR
jgi:hypothetical protein